MIDYNNVTLIPLRALTEMVQRLSLGVQGVFMNEARRTLVVYADNRYHQYPLEQFIARGVEKDLAQVAYDLVNGNCHIRKRQ